MSVTGDRACARKTRAVKRECLFVAALARVGAGDALGSDRFFNGHLARPQEHGTLGTHPILGDELRALRRLQREQSARSRRTHRL
jgi:hypothetical protein